MTNENSNERVRDKRIKCREGKEKYEVGDEREDEREDEKKDRKRVVSRARRNVDRTLRNSNAYFARITGST